MERTIRPSRFPVSALAFFACAWFALDVHASDPTKEFGEALDMYHALVTRLVGEGWTWGEGGNVQVSLRIKSKGGCLDWQRAVFEMLASKSWCHLKYAKVRRNLIMVHHAVRVQVPELTIDVVFDPWLEGNRADRRYTGSERIGRGTIKGNVAYYTWPAWSTARLRTGVEGSWVLPNHGPECGEKHGRRPPKAPMLAEGLLAIGGRRTRPPAVGIHAPESIVTALNRS